jgi:hypothetical protein
MMNAFFQCCGLDPDPDPAGGKLPQNKKENIEISCFEVLDALC